MWDIAQTLLNGLTLSGLYALIAIGLTLFFGVMGIFNLAHGEFAVGCVLLVWWISSRWDVDPLIALGPSLVAICLLGLVSYRWLYEPVLGSSVLSQLLMAVGISLVLQNGMQLVFGGDFHGLSSSYGSRVIHVGELSVSFMRLMGLLVGVAISVATLLLLKYSRFGRDVRAVAQDRELASISGISVRRTFGLIAVLGSAFAGLAGFMLGFINPVGPHSGLYFTLKATSIVVLGGLGSVTGALIGAFILGMSEVMIAAYVPGGAAWSQAVAFVVLIAVLLVRPRGLLGQH